MKNKDLQGLYEYIVNSNASNEEVKEFTECLQKYLENGNTFKFKDRGTHILNVALTEEVKNILSNMEDERLVNLSEDKFDYVANGIAYELVYYADNVWEHIDSFVDYVKEDYLRDLESESE